MILAIGGKVIHGDEKTGRRIRLGGGNVILDMLSLKSI